MCAQGPAHYLPQDNITALSLAADGADLDILRAVVAAMLPRGGRLCADQDSASLVGASAVSPKRCRRGGLRRRCCQADESLEPGGSPGR